jgi:ribosome-binding protein aMBF1 (putative translation factor)
MAKKKICGERWQSMSDLHDYIEKRKLRDKEFALNYDVGYEEFKIGYVIKELRIKEGMTQEELAEKMHTKKSVISRMENHSEDIRLSTLSKVAEVFGKKLQIAIQ